MEITKRIAELFENRGSSQYGGEAVTQLEHALQCAALAEKEQSRPELVVASLLHDIGHLLHDLPDTAPDEGIDDHHENSGHRFLETHFGAEVTEPVRLHVAAKRYLCGADSDYESQLSEPSRVSLALQGGPMTAEEQADFRQSSHWEDALLVRKWDDLAKVAGLETPSLDHYLPMIAQLAR